MSQLTQTQEGEKSHKKVSRHTYCLRRSHVGLLEWCALIILNQLLVIVSILFIFLLTIRFSMPATLLRGDGAVGRLNVRLRQIMLLKGKQNFEKSSVKPESFRMNT